MSERPIQRIAYTFDEAAASIGVSPDSFRRHVLPTIRTVRQGRLRLVPVRDLERWVDEHAARFTEL